MQPTPDFACAMEPDEPVTGLDLSNLAWRTISVRRLEGSFKSSEPPRRDRHNGMRARRCVACLASNFLQFLFCLCLERAIGLFAVLTVSPSPL